MDLPRHRDLCAQQSGDQPSVWQPTGHVWFLHPARDQSWWVRKTTRQPTILVVACFAYSDNTNRHPTLRLTLQRLDWKINGFLSNKYLLAGTSILILLTDCGGRIGIQMACLDCVKAWISTETLDINGVTRSTYLIPGQPLPFLALTLIMVVKHSLNQRPEPSGTLSCPRDTDCMDILPSTASETKFSILGATRPRQLMMFKICALLPRLQKERSATVLLKNGLSLISCFLTLP